MSYADCISRISELDSLIRRMDPGWATSGYSLADVINADSPFAGVLESVAGQSGSDATDSSSIDGASASPSALGLLGYGATSSLYTKPNVIAIQSSSPTATSTGLAFETPLPGARLTQGFGPTTETLEPSATVDGVTYAHYHNGLDLAAPLGTAIRAAASGTVTFAGKESDGAVVVKIRHDDGYTTLYGHLDPSLDVKVGDVVTEGQTIGKVGMTGNTTGPHLHFSLFDPNGKAIDPTTNLKAGLLPDPATLLGPSDDDPTQLTSESGPAALARFDAVASKIPYAAQIRQAAISAGIDPLLLTGLVYTESNFHPTAVSRCGAEGLTQLMPKTARSLGVSDPFDPQQNLNGGAQYIAKQLRNFGRVDLALAAYNAGPGAIGRLGAVPDSKAGYVRKILGKWSSLKEQAA